MTEPNQRPFESLRDHDPMELSEAQLRQLYDEEELERSLSLFSAYVTEVRLSTDAASAETSAETPTLDIATERRPSTPLSSRLADHSLSEYIAYNYLLPWLPPAAGATPTFTLKRLSLTAQRLYLALFPSYYALLSNLAQLATWKDYQRSLRYCIMFWFLWFHGLLLPAMVFRIAFGLLRCRMSPYPTVRELQERRQESARALKFGEAVQQQLSVTTLGPIEMWRLFKLYKAGGKGKAQPAVGNMIETDDDDDDDDDDFKRDVLYFLNELADLHERVKNVFAWRHPDVSLRYLFLLIVVGFGTLVLPAKYIAKLVFGFGGVLFWHFTPVVAALPRVDRTRVSLFGDAPTDADYAMELISKRIAAGQNIGSASPGNQPRRASNASASTERLTPGTPYEVQSTGGDAVNWKKWGERVARGKAFLCEGKQILSASNSADLTSAKTTAIHRPGTEDTFTFLAQYASRPGLITLTPSTMLFTSLTGTHARLVIPCDRVRGVRKSGLMKGISITWAPEESTGGEEREERFHWVGNRDELFARLVGSDGGRRWIRV